MADWDDVGTFVMKDRPLVWNERAKPFVEQRSGYRAHLLFVVEEIDPADEVAQLEAFGLGSAGLDAEDEKLGSAMLERKEVIAELIASHCLNPGPESVQPRDHIGSCHLRRRPVSRRDAVKAGAPASALGVHFEFHFDSPTGSAPSAPMRVIAYFPGRLGIERIGIFSFSLAYRFFTMSEVMADFVPEGFANDSADSITW